MINLSRFIFSTFLILLLAVPCLAAPSLIISGHPNYPPYMWNANGSLVGVGPEIAESICKELGFTCEQRPLGSWNRVQELARNGNIDMIVQWRPETARCPCPGFGNRAECAVDG